MPRKILPVCSILIQYGGSITCTVSNHRHYSADLEQGSEIPCKIKFLTLSSAKEKAEISVIAVLSNFGRENFDKLMQFHQICQDFPTLKFCVIYTLYISILELYSCGISKIKLPYNIKDAIR